MAAHDTVESVPTIAWNRCPSSVECAMYGRANIDLLKARLVAVS